ncbi:MAG: hypothetical protein EPN97_01380 [Alphaproteobacteria bacterium]|nr:MAG: hypothetical protein EPN97_01380 [Alphaproteobacteria bacterium]
MGLGKRTTFTGVIKNEKGAIVLDTGSGPALEINMNGFNPEADKAALAPFVGKRVKVEGIAGSGRAMLLVNGVSDITVLGPRGRPMRPPQP